jgi:hypothetical protein
METLAFLGLLGLGYAAAPKSKEIERAETFENEKKTADEMNPVMRSPTTEQILGRRSFSSGSGRFDDQYNVASRSKMLPREPNPEGFQGDLFQYATKPSKLGGGLGGVVPDQSSVASQPLLQMRPDSTETATPRPEFVSPLTGIAYKSGEFKHNNMVPFYRGQMKQNTLGDTNRQVLDDFTGAGSLQFAKREQTPFFEPTKTPVGNPFGMEATTDFQQSRITDPNNRANEAPVEPVRVGPGLNQGYTHIPSGGFHQREGEDYVLQRMPRTDDLRVASNPKLTYESPVVPGSHFVTNGGSAETVGEVRKYSPDTFYINHNGERNFVTTGADIKSTARAIQVVKDTSRTTTTTEYAGHAGAVESKATYTVGSTRAPLVKQHGPFGWRNADTSAYFNSNTDAEQNDYGKAGVELLPNERYYTGERVHGTNLVADQRETTLPLQDTARSTRAELLVDNIRGAGNFTAMGGGLPSKMTTYDPNDVAKTTIKETTIDNDWLGTAAPVGAQPKMKVYDPNDTARVTTKETTIDNDWMGGAAPTSAQPKMTVYDPNDVARTTIKETTIDNDWIGAATGANQAQKLTVYDPDDIARVTGRNTLAAWDVYRNFGTQVPEKATIRVQDGVRSTTKASISAKSAYTGIAVSDAKQESSRVAATNMRHYAQRENISKGRAPTNSGTKIFNGENYVKMQYKKIVSDSINDRTPVYDRVSSEIPGAEVIGIQRPRATLKLDVDASRNQPEIITALDSNPYTIPIHKIANGSYRSPPA